MPRLSQAVVFSSESKDLPFQFLYIDINRYWFGEPDSELANLATCIWRSREDAKKGGTGPAHRKAAGATRSMYAFWQIDQHRLIIRDNVEDWEIIPWQDSV